MPQLGSYQYRGLHITRAGAAGSNGFSFYRFNVGARETEETLHIGELGLLTSGATKVKRRKAKRAVKLVW